MHRSLKLSNVWAIRAADKRAWNYWVTCLPTTAESVVVGKQRWALPILQWSLWHFLSPFASFQWAPVISPFFECCITASGTFCCILCHLGIEFSGMPTYQVKAVPSRDCTSNCSSASLVAGELFITDPHLGRKWEMCGFRILLNILKLGILKFGGKGLCRPMEGMVLWQQG